MKFNNKIKLRMFRSKWIASILSIGAATVSTVGSANAQETGKDNIYITGLKACQLVAEDAARLSCYDTAVGKVVTASDDGEVRVIDEAEVKKTRRGLFGMNLKLFGSDEEEQNLFQSTITDVSVSGSTVFITIEDGNAVWRIPSAKSRTMRAKPGDPVEFKKASFGSYFVRINGQIGEKGSRVR